MSALAGEYYIERESVADAVRRRSSLNVIHLSTMWSDFVGVLKVQGDALDGAYLRRWATVLGVEDLLDRALRDAGAC